MNINLMNEYIALFSNALSSTESQFMATICQRFNSNKDGVQDTNAYEQCEFNQRIILSHDEYTVLRYLRRRLANKFGLPLSHIEPFQLFHYGNDQGYPPHSDAFDADSAFLDSGGNRLFAIYIYLNTVIEGGADYIKSNNSYILPIANTGFIVRVSDTYGNKIDAVQMASEPVKDGYKDILCTWVREKDYYASTEGTTMISQETISNPAKVCLVGTIKTTGDK